MGKTHYSGQLIESGVKNSLDTNRVESIRAHQAWIPANLFAFTTGTWVFTRNGTGDSSFNKTNDVDQTSTAHIDISQALLATTNALDLGMDERARGTRINSIAGVYMNPTTNGSDLDAVPSFTMQQFTTFTNGATLGAVTSIPGTNSGGSITASDTLVRVVTFTLTTPLVLSAGINVTAELTIDSSATSNIHVYGAYINFDTLL